MSTNDSADIAARLAGGKSRLEQLRNLRARFEGEHDRAVADLEAARQDAITRFGTDNPDEIEAAASQILAESEAEVSVFKQEIDEVCTDLADMGISVGG